MSGSSLGYLTFKTFLVIKFELVKLISFHKAGRVELALFTNKVDFVELYTLTSTSDV